MIPIRNEGIGSLLRPPHLLEARQQVERGNLSSAAFKCIEDRAVDEAAALQEAAGLDVVTDGEQRRYAFFGHLVEALEGFDKFAGWAIQFHDEQGHEITLKRPVVPLERLAVSPQCGFASTSEGNRLSPEDQRRKLEVVSESARAVWPAPARYASLA